MKTSKGLLPTNQMPDVPESGSAPLTAAMLRAAVRTPLPRPPFVVSPDDYERIRKEHEDK